MADEAIVPRAKTPKTPPAPTDMCSLHGYRHQFQDLYDAVTSFIGEGDTTWPGAVSLVKALKDCRVVK